MQTTTYTLQRLVLATGGDGPSNPWDALGMCIRLSKEHTPLQLGMCISDFI